MVFLKDFLNVKDLAEVSNRTTKRFFDDLITTDLNNDFIRLIGLETLLKLTLLKAISVDFTYDLIVDISSSEASELLVKKIRYLFLLNATDTRTSEAIKVLKNHEDSDVSSEAHLYFGMQFFFRNHIENNPINFIKDLRIAKNNFEVSFSQIENRLDSELYFHICNTLSFTLSRALKEAESSLEIVAALLWNYNIRSTDNKVRVLDLKVYEVLKNLVEFVSSLDDVDSKWTNYYDRFAQLCLLNSSFLTHTVHEDIMADTLFQSWKDKLKINVTNLYIANNLSSKVTLVKNIIGNLTEDKTELKEFLSEILSSIGSEQKKKEYPPSILVNICNFFPQVSPDEIARKLSEYLILDAIAILDIIAYFSKNNFLSDTHSQINDPVRKEIYQRIEAEIIDIIPDENNSVRAKFLLILSEIINYQLRSNLNMGHFKILYEKGKVSEADYQDSIYLHLALSQEGRNYTFEKSKVADGGRVDILYSDDHVTIPIEIKKTTTILNDKEIENFFLGQAQTYTYPFNQIGFFVLFDASDKQRNKAPMNDVRSLFKLYHVKPLHNINDDYPDYVLSVIIPAGREMPSEKSKYVK